MLQLSEGLKELGYEVSFWGMKDKLNTVDDTYNCFPDNIDFKLLSGKQKVKALINTIYSIENQKRISIILDQFQPDIAHIHNFNFQLTPSILPELKKRGVKIVYTAHDSQLVCPYHRLFNFQQNKVCTKCVNGSFYNCIKNKCFDASLVKSALGAFESCLFHSLDFYNKYFDMIISPSNFLANHIKNRYKKSIKVIPNFIVHQPKTTTKEEYILYYGRISGEKGILDIYNAFNELNYKLKIVGSGPDANAIKETKHIEYLGPKYGEELFEIIRKARYVIQPSKGYENCPMTVIESYANGTPVIAPNHSGFLELIDENKTGYLIDFGNTLIDNLIRILDAKTDMSNNCTTKFKQEFSKEVHIPKIVELYKGLLDESI